MICAIYSIFHIFYSAEKTNQNTEILENHSMWGYFQTDFADVNMNQGKLCKPAPINYYGYREDGDNFRKNKKHEIVFVQENA